MLSCRRTEGYTNAILIYDTGLLGNGPSDTVFYDFNESHKNGFLCSLENYSVPDKLFCNAHTKPPAKKDIYSALEMRRGKSELDW